MYPTSFESCYFELIQKDLVLKLQFMDDTNNMNYGMQFERERTHWNNRFRYFSRQENYLLRRMNETLTNMEIETRPLDSTILTTNILRTQSMNYIMIREISLYFEHKLFYFNLIAKI